MSCFDYDEAKKCQEQLGGPRKMETVLVEKGYYTYIIIRDHLLGGTVSVMRRRDVSQNDEVLASYIKSLSRGSLRYTALLLIIYFAFLSSRPSKIRLRDAKNN